mmetsp:Transcript_8178/g.23354  ORF Transcript_8178/g.23354 Transcript_8178/m.23354 type:complete len:277 (+) Transcript_8178:141-971(+)
MAAMQHDDGLLEDLKFDEELEGFLSGTGPSSGMVDLQPQPTSFGNTFDGLPEPGAAPEAKAAAESSTASKAIGLAAAAFGSAAGALMGGKFAASRDVIGGAVGNMASAAVPTSLQPMKETAGRFLSKAAPWKDFVWPLSVPAASDGCSRITANIFHFQTNYAILFVVQLVLGIMSQPSAVICIVMTVVVWIFFLKKNEDPEWTPTLGGMPLGPVQRWLLLAAATTLVLLFFIGGTIINNSFMFLLCAFVHGVLHDPPAGTLPGSTSPSGLQGEVPI